MDNSDKDIPVENQEKSVFECDSDDEITSVVNKCFTSDANMFFIIKNMKKVAPFMTDDEFEEKMTSLLKLYFKDGFMHGMNQAIDASIKKLTSFGNVNAYMILTMKDSEVSTIMKQAFYFDKHVYVDDSCDNDGCHIQNEVKSVKSCKNDEFFDDASNKDNKIIQYINERSEKIMELMDKLCVENNVHNHIRVPYWICIKALKCIASSEV